MFSEGVLLGLIAAIGWGISDFFAKISATREKNYLPIHISALTSLILLFAYNTLFPIPGYSSLNIILPIASVSFFMSIGWWLFMLSLRSAKISIQGPVSASYGLVTLILGIMILGEAPTLLQVMGALLVIIGAIFVSLESTNLRKMSFNKDVAFAIIASISWGIAFIVMVPFAKAYPPTIAFQSHIFFSFIFSSAIVLITGKKFLPEKKIDFLPSIGLGICDSVANLAYYTAAAFFFTSLLAPISSIYPVFTIILAYLFLKERLLRHQFLSILTILTGIVLISV